MNYIRYFKKFDNWMGCAYKAQAGAFGFEDGEDRRVLYQYIFMVLLNTQRLFRVSLY